MAKILVVDDSKILRAELTDALKEVGHSTVEASNGIEGLQTAVNCHDLNLIIVDQNMPEMDGLTMCKRIREIPAHKFTPIFFVTTEGSDGYRDQAKGVDVKLWIIKPFKLESIVNAVNKMLIQKAS